MREVVWIVQVQKHSFYRMIFRYVNNGTDSVAGLLSFKPFASHEDDQQANVFFEPNKLPKTEFATTKFKQIHQVLLSPGNWTASLRVDKDILIDYMVLIPEAYYEARLLRDSDSPACRDNQVVGELCRFYEYPDYGKTARKISGDEGRSTSRDTGTVGVKKNDDVELGRRLKALGSMAVIDELHTKTLFEFRIPQSQIGKYAVVINYHNPSIPGIGANIPTKLEVKVISNELPTVETDIVFSDCPYSFLCRQVITLGTGEVASLDLTPSSTITLEPTEIVENKTLLIESLNVIPYNEWSLDYVVPRVTCVMKNGICMESNYANLQEGTKIEFERDQNLERVTVQNGHSYVSVNDTINFVEIRGRVPTPGRYKFIIHYMQPKSPSYDAEITMIQDEQHFNAMAGIAFCPTLQGCRSVMYQQSNSSTFYVSDHFSLTVRVPPEKSVFLDYVIAIPVDLIDDNAFLMMPLHLSDDFIAECGRYAFEISSQNSSDFCRRSVFSLTVDYNGAAFPCKCSIQGSKSYECESFGGQCPCKPNVIGRQCTRCKTGFYGFPDCKQCNCPSTAYCHPRTGKCICPPKVTGDKCDQCMIHTYGYDQYLGCEECDCHSRGVMKMPNGKADLQCNVTTGQCPCRQTIVGRKCDRCLPGYAYFPFCQLCNCDIRGVTEDICNQGDATCYCKDHVRGENCDVCAPDAYFLEESNPSGCTKCFCFGNTDRCRPSTMMRTVMSGLEGEWKLALITTDDKMLNISTTLDARMEENRGTNFGAWSAVIQSDDEFAIKTNYYMSVPKSYLGKSITSYGGYLNYSIVNEVSKADYKGSALSFDVILVGSSLTIGYQQDEQPDSPGTSFAYSVPIIERYFRHLNRNPVTREQMMMVLIKLDAIYLRVSYFRPSRSFQAINFALESANPDSTSLTHGAARVEQCFCPKQYKGSSCEQCNDGYYRATSSPYLGYCVPCQCNGHSEECDVETGKCFNCKHNTHGDHCEFCNSGYYGNATRGNPYDCIICPCPRPDVSNNFATSCEVSDDGLNVKCDCKPEYVGLTCDSCAAGHYGRPHELGDYCKPCECNGNIDPSNPAACDSVSGICQLCLNDTFGPACEICKPGYYGDALIRKDCKSCSCDSCGTARCDNFNGNCVCKSNVVGQLCDQCKKDHYWIDHAAGACDGCTPCGCQNASLSTGCDPFSGQCQCAPGVGGRTCDHCEPGYWKYSPDGCTSCNCGMKFSYGAVCDQEIGQCQCLPGVVGKNCDSCPWRWVFIEKVGCRQCDDCTHFLLDDTDYMKNVTKDAFREIKDASISLFAVRKANHLNKKIEEYQQLIRNEVANPSVQLSPVDLDVKDLERILSTLESNSSFMERQVIKARDEASLARQAAMEGKDLIKQTINISTLILEEVKLLEESFSNPVIAQNIEEKIFISETVLQYLKDTVFDGQHEGAKLELGNAKNLTESIDSFSHPEKRNGKGIIDTEASLQLLHDRLWELHNMTNSVTTMIVRTEQLGAVATETQEKINDDKKKSKVFLDQVSEAIREAKEKLRESNIFLTSYAGRMIDILEATKQLIRKKDRLRRSLSNHILDDRGLADKVHEAQYHALKLIGEAKELEKLIIGTNEASRIYITAAEAYTYITGNMTQARNSAEGADQAWNDYQGKRNANRANVQPSLERSKELKKEAEELSVKFDAELSVPLAAAASNVTYLKTKLDGHKRTHEVMIADLNNLPKKELEILSGTAVGSSEAALDNAKSVLQKVLQTHDNIEEAAKKAGKIPEEYRAVKHDHEHANSHTEIVEQLIPDLKTKMARVEEKFPKINEVQSVLDKQIREIRERIASARGFANRIEVGVDIQSSTSIQLRNPDQMIQSGIYTKFAMSFKTKENNGLLAYIGNPVVAPSTSSVLDNDIQGDEPEVTSTEATPSSTSGDFMAIEIRSSRIVFTIDLGSGPENIDNRMFVSNDAWHDIVVERIGKNVILLVSANDSKQETSEGILTGANNVFNLDTLRSRIFVSGIPQGVEVQKDVRETQLKSGQVANVVFGDTPLGLWNFVEGIENKNGAEIKQIYSGSSSANGLRFEGNSHVVVQNPKHNIIMETYIRFNFKTYAKEGIMFLMENATESGMDFLSIFLSEGRVHLSFDLGSGYLLLSSKENKTFNDGNWHSVEVSRKEKIGILKVDSVEMEEKVAIGISSDLNINNRIYIGGYPKQHPYPISKSSFEGCIKDVQIDNVSIDLTKNIEASPKVVKGCPAAVSREASFSTAFKGFIEMPLTIDINNKVTLSMKYRTLERPGLLFYVSNDDHTSSLALYLNEIGQIVLRSEPGGAVASTKNSYYGDSWHYITATKDENRIIIEVDDVFDDAASVETSTPLEIFNPNEQRVVYFAGVPGPQMYILGGKGIPVHYVGCFGDATLNNVFQNFATSSNRPGASLASCPLDTKSGSFASNVSSIDPTEQPFITTTPSITIEGCSIPLNPALDLDVTPEDGLRFGNGPDTRNEFNIPSAVISSLTDKSEFEIEFKVNVNATEGLLLYITGLKQIDFVGIYMQNGSICYTWNNGGKPAWARKDEPVNDGKWHKVSVTRTEKSGSMRIDDGQEIFTSSLGTETALNVKNPLFIGGLPNDLQKGAKANLRGIANSFPGCLRNLVIKREPQDFAKDSIPFGSKACSSKIETGVGVFFHSPSPLSTASHYVVLKDKYRVGDKVKIDMKIRPRSRSGVLLSVSSKMDFLILQIVDGAILFTVDNGGGPFNVSIKPETALCDGKWHTLQAVKVNNFITLAVDSGEIAIGIGQAGISSTDTNDPLFLGGVPSGQAIPGLLTRDQYVGCIRDIEIADRPVGFASSVVYGDVTLNSCPTT